MQTESTIPSSYLSPDRICTDLTVTSKKDLLRQVSQHLAQAAQPHTADDIFVSLMERESLGSTGIEDGVAIPHGRLPGLMQPVLGFVNTSVPIDFGAIDEFPSDIFFVLLAPQTGNSIHLKILASLSRLLHQPNFLSQLRNCKTAEAVMHCIQRWEADTAC